MKAVIPSAVDGGECIVLVSSRPTIIHARPLNAKEDMYWKESNCMGHGTVHTTISCLFLHGLPNTYFNPRSYIPTYLLA